MSLPAAVEDVLNANEIEYEMTETPEFSGLFSPITQYNNWAGATRCVLLSSGESRLQAILPAAHLLDLEAINKLTGKDWRAATAEDLASLVSDKALFSLPAIPQLTGIQTIVDETVFQQSEIVLESGAETGLIRLSNIAFKRLLEKTVTGDISSSVNKNAFNDASKDSEQISTAVANFTTKRMQQRLEDTLEFPPLPDTAQRIIKLRVNPNADIKDLSDIVEIDPSLSAQVVSWAASPYYAAPGKISSVQDAIVRVLGFDLVMNLSLGLALGKTLKMPKDAPQGFTGYWHQAVYTAATIEELIKAIPAKSRPSMGLSCLSGILHNFGYLVLAEVFPPYFSNVCRHIEVNPHLGHNSIERHLLGVDREQMGSWLMNYWNMPEEVCVALRHQANPYYDGPLCEYANVLFVATHLLKNHGVGDSALEPIPDSVFERLKLDRETAQNAVNNVLSCAEDIQQMADSLDPSKA
jgi:HD-like signal output (HDOD) protein/prolyl-tRNA editing enzyme YbaK/EbsC (Cys-tRNA(Pro) deacylase)